MPHARSTEVSIPETREMPADWLLCRRPPTGSLPADTPLTSSNSRSQATFIPVFRIRPLLPTRKESLRFTEEPEPYFSRISALAQAGDNIVTSPFLYGGTYNLFRHSLRKLGIEVRIAPDEAPSTIASLCDGHTKAIFIESLGNPTCAVPDIEGIAEVARKTDVPLVVDNTFGAGGYLCNPFDWGADIVVDSATKWINGHGTAMGGVIVDGGRYNWRNGKFPQLDGPSDGYHGLNLCDAFGDAAFAVKCRVDGLRDFGTCPSPFDSYLM